jgi:hypothetical protein
MVVAESIELGASYAGNRGGGRAHRGEGAGRNLENGPGLQRCPTSSYSVARLGDLEAGPTATTIPHFTHPPALDSCDSDDEILILHPRLCRLDSFTSPPFVCPWPAVQADGNS